MYVAHARNVRDLYLQENPSNGSRDATERVDCLASARDNPQ